MYMRVIRVSQRDHLSESVLLVLGNVEAKSRNDRGVKTFDLSAGLG